MVPVEAQPPNAACGCLLGWFLTCWDFQGGSPQKTPPYPQLWSWVEAAPAAAPTVPTRGRARSFCLQTSLSL